MSRRYLMHMSSALAHGEPANGPFFLLFGGVNDHLGVDGRFVAELQRLGLRPRLPPERNGPPEPGDPDVVAQADIAFGTLNARAQLRRAVAEAHSDVLKAADFFGLTPAQASQAMAHLHVALEPDLPHSHAGAGDHPLAPVGSQADMLGHMREICQMAYLCAQMSAADYVFWSPARLWSQSAHFVRAVEEMFQSGLPPVLHFVAFPPAHADDGVMLNGEGEGAPDSGVERARISRGLGYFCGQELLLAPGHRLTDEEVLRRLSRLATEMIVNGPVVEPMQVAGLAKDEQIMLVPAQPAYGASGLVRVSIRHPSAGNP